MDRESPAQIRSAAATAQFAALEPSWAGIRSSGQLRSLLILGALFNRRIYVHDTQLADNPHLLKDYERRHDYMLNLYNLLTDLIRAGVVVVGLRDGTYMPQTDELILCDSLEDLVRSWERRDPSTSWVVDPSSSARLALVSDVDRLAQDEGSRLLRYSYRSIKEDFMLQVRQSLYSRSGVLHGLVVEHGSDLARAYAAIVERPWFSHSGIFSLLREVKIDPTDPLLQIHGMFDEAAYARWRESRLLGSDWSNSRTGNSERMLGSFIESRTESAAESVRGLESQALRMLDCPGADLLATLTGDEIINLRNHADELFKLQEIFEVSVSGYAGSLEEAMADSAASYWDYVCSYLRQTRPNMTRERTRIGIFLRQHLPEVSQVAEKFVTVGLSSVVRVVLDIIPGVRTLSDGSRDILARHISLDFVFFSESEGLRALRRSMPARGWLAPDARLQVNQAPDVQR